MSTIIRRHADRRDASRASFPFSLDRWMMGDRYGDVSHLLQDGRVEVKTDKGATLKAFPHQFRAILPTSTGFYVTTRCNFAHRLRDGKPIAHECDIIPPAALAAEMAGDYDKAIEIIQAAKPLRHMRRGVVAAILAALLSLPAFAAEPCKVNVNAATPSEIQLLARTGEVLAGRIVAGRPLDAEKLDAVKGVGPSWLAVNGPHVAFSGPTTCKAKIPSPKAPKVAAQAPKL